MPKAGFAPPLASWVRSDLAGLFSETILQGSAFVHEFLDPDELRRSYALHASGARDHARGLWLALMLELWHRNFGRPVRVEL